MWLVKLKCPTLMGVFFSCEATLCYKGVSWVSKGCPDGIPSLGLSLTNPRMVTDQPKDGPPPEGSVLQVFRQTQKLTPVDNCYKWCTTMHSMVTHQP